MKAIRLKHILVRRKDVLEVQDTGIYKRITIKMNNQGVIIRDTVQGSEIGTKRQFLVRKGQLVISKIDAVGILPDECDNAIITGNFWAFDINTQSLDSLYFNYLTSTPLFIDFFIKASDGTTNRRYLDESKFLAMEIPLPPLEEQRRIVARIEELAGAIAEARGLRARSIEESTNLYSVTLSTLIQSQQEDWRQELVSDVVIDISAGWSPQCEGYPASKQEWGILKTTSVQWNNFIARENKLLPKSLNPRPSLTVKKGDVLVTRAGPRQRVGVVAAARENYDKLMISDKIIRLKPDIDKVDPRFLEISLSSDFSQEYLVNRKTGLADAQVNISQAIVRAMPITYPPLSEQRRIVAYLDDIQAKVDALKRLQAETAAELDALLPSILDKAFKGEL